MPRTMSAATAMPTRRGKGPDTIANAAVVAPPKLMRATVRVVTPVRLARVEYRVRPSVCPAPPSPRAQAAAVAPAPRAISGAAYMAKLFSVSAAPSIRNGRLWATDPLLVSRGEAGAAAGGHGPRSARAWAGTVTRARNTASTA